MAANNEGSCDLPVLETLCFSESTSTKKAEASSTEGNVVPGEEPVSFGVCIFCDFQLNLAEDKDTLLRHMILSHKLVLADVKLIANLQKYLAYWKERMVDHVITDFCSAIQINSKETDIGLREEYYLLSDVLPEDKLLRQNLQREKLEAILAFQQKEREDETFSRSCLFCREHFIGNRSELFDHMAFDHGFNVGQPDNLVFTTEFLDKLQEKLTNLQCLYCEKSFRDRPTLKEHMRKKQHKRIKSNNKTYDKYYVINYLEIGKNWESFQSAEEANLEHDMDEETWDDWHDESGSQAICLFCTFSSTITDNLQTHMKDSHGLDLAAIKKSQNLDFYQQVKLINFIRRKVHQLKCFNCDLQFDSWELLMSHMETNNHFSQIPDSKVWNQPQYYFPTYENDNLLCHLLDDMIPNDSRYQVISEETEVPAETLLPKCVLSEITDVDNQYFM